MIFAMAVTFMMFIKKLQSNSIDFLPFLAELYISELFEPNLFFFKKFTLTFALNTHFFAEFLR